MHIGAARLALGPCKVRCGRPHLDAAGRAWPCKVRCAPAPTSSLGGGLQYLLGVGGSEERLRVVIADDHHFFRDGLREMLEAGGIEVVGEASDGEEAVALTRRLAPDVVLLDLNMPGASGIDALRELAGSAPRVQGVILTASTQNADVLDALAAGACGYLLKDMRADRLVSSVRQAAEGDMVLSAEVARALRAHVRAGADASLSADEDKRAAQDAGERAALTPREEEVLRLIAEGADNAAIGQALSISPHTVKQYVANIFEKLGVRSRVQAAVHAVRAGLV